MSVTTEEATAIAQQAYIFFFPMVQSYGNMLSQTQEPSDSIVNFRFNRLRHLDILNDVTETGNIDTAYSVAWLDLRAEPVILTLPPVPDKRYYSFLMVDGYTHNIGMLGARTTGHDGGVYMIAGPNWTGERPEGVNEVFISESQFVFLLGRTLVKNEEDVPIVRGIQESYQLTLLHQFLGTTRPPVLLTPDFVPVDKDKLTDLEYFRYANYIMKFIAIHPTEVELFERFSCIGIIPGEDFPPRSMSLELRLAIEKGLSLGKKEVFDYAFNTTDGYRQDGWGTFLDPPLFGHRSVMQGHYKLRATGAVAGLYGNDLEETLYLQANKDPEGAALNGLSHKYTMRFNPGDLPVVDGFWSLTLYQSDQELAENEINRHSIGDRTPGLHYTADGSLTIFVQNGKPEKEEEQANWLPAPKGRFFIVMRLYLPRKDAITPPPYFPPGVQRADWPNLSDGVISFLIDYICYNF